MRGTSQEMIPFFLGTWRNLGKEFFDQSQWGKMILMSSKGV